jgi:metal-responsive CopG/Arc/MetJ family transcriptional regulator
MAQNNITVRLPDDMLERIEQVREKLEERERDPINNPSGEVSRSGAIRYLISQGLDAADDLGGSNE